MVRYIDTLSDEERAAVLADRKAAREEIAKLKEQAEPPADMNAFIRGQTGAKAAQDFEHGGGGGRWLAVDGGNRCIGVVFACRAIGRDAQLHGFAAAFHGEYTIEQHEAAEDDNRRTYC